MTGDRFFADQFVGGTLGSSCSAEPGCITCGDVAVSLTVVSVVGADATCRDEQGREELVATELVGDVHAGDRLLVHAGVAIERLSAVPVGG
ncbi:MAG: HypC/HybG/HupF family hydrogenase formation chaperone [Mycobacteriales bacterium]